MKKTSRIYFSLLLGLVFISNNIFAQISEGGIPPSLQITQTVRSTSLVPVYDAPVTFDVNRLIWEDQQVDKNGGIPRFAINIPVIDSIININNSGEWSYLDNSVKIWRQTIKAKDAQGIILSYKDFYLPKGSKLFIYNKDQSEILGAYTEKTNPQGGLFATELIQGDEITLEYVCSKESEDKPRIIIDKIGYAYNLPSSILTKNSSDTGLNKSDRCMININCADGLPWQKQKRGVVRIMVSLYGAWGYCTGSLVNNTAQDGKPYILSANHCFPSNAIPEQTIYYFDFEFPGCSNGTTVPSTVWTLVGSEIIVNTPINGGGDGTLLLLKDNIPLDKHPYFNGWNRLNIPATSGVVIHHPAGDVKKITTYVSPLTTGYFNAGAIVSAKESAWQVKYDGRSVTQEGSSGSPIFNQDGLIVGTLSGGSSYCDTPEGLDFFAKLWYNWDQYKTPSGQPEQKMSVYLDPINSGITSLFGYDPNPPTGIEDEIVTEVAKEITIFPNPVQSDLNINTKGIIKNVSVFDATGKLVYRQDNYNSSTISISANTWIKGIYMVVVNTENKRLTDKFLKN